MHQQPETNYYPSLFTQPRCSFHILPVIPLFHFNFYTLFIKLPVTVCTSGAVTTPDVYNGFLLQEHFCPNHKGAARKGLWGAQAPMKYTFVPLLLVASIEPSAYCSC